MSCGILVSRLAKGQFYRVGVWRGGVGLGVELGVWYMCGWSGACACVPVWGVRRTLKAWWGWVSPAVVSGPFLPVCKDEVIITLLLAHQHSNLGYTDFKSKQVQYDSQFAQHPKVGVYMAFEHTLTHKKTTTPMI